MIACCVFHYSKKFYFAKRYIFHLEKVPLCVVVFTLIIFECLRYKFRLKFIELVTSSLSDHWVVSNQNFWGLPKVALNHFIYPLPDYNEKESRPKMHKTHMGPILKNIPWLVTRPKVDIWGLSCTCASNLQEWFVIWLWKFDLQRN